MEEEESFLGKDEKSQRPKITVCGCSVPFTLAVIFFSAGTIIGMVGQQVALPLFLSSCGDVAGEYFVLFFCATAFNFIFWIPSSYLIIKKQIKEDVKKYRKQWKLALIGICNAFNGILIVFSSSLSRTPGPLQAILIQAMIPFTLLFSKFILRKRYKWQQILGAVIVLVGIFLSLTPIFVALYKGEVSIELGSEVYWPFIFVLGTIPGVFMNIAEEWVFHDIPHYDVTYMLAWQSLYQWTTILVCFWLDIIPGFGTSKDIHDWANSFANGWKCVFAPDTIHIENNRCYYAAPLGFTFILTYSFSYIFGSLLMKYASANYNSIVSALAPPLSVFFWLMFPKLNLWGGGQPYTSLDIIFDASALPLLLLGLVLYRWFEEKKKHLSTKDIDSPEYIIQYN